MIADDVAAAYADRDAALERLGAVLAERDAAIRSRDGWASRMAEFATAEQRIAELEAEVEALERPCDGGCSYYTGPEETCSAHGRPVAEVWEIANRFAEERDQLARLHEVATERVVQAHAVIAALREADAAHREQEGAGVEIRVAGGSWRDLADFLGEGAKTDG